MGFLSSKVTPAHKERKQERIEDHTNDEEPPNCRSYLSRHLYTPYTVHYVSSDKRSEDLAEEFSKSFFFKSLLEIRIDIRIQKSIRIILDKVIPI